MEPLGVSLSVWWVKDCPDHCDGTVLWNCWTTFFIACCVHDKHVPQQTELQLQVLIPTLKHHLCVIFNSLLLSAGAKVFDTSAGKGRCWFIYMKWGDCTMGHNLSPPFPSSCSGFLLILYPGWEGMAGAEQQCCAVHEQSGLSLGPEQCQLIWSH